MVSFRLVCVLLFISVFCMGQSTRQEDSLINLLKTTPHSQHASIYNELFYLNYNGEKVEKAIGFSHKALALAKKYDDLDEEYIALLNVADGNRETGNSDSAIIFGKEALTLALTMENKLYIARANNNLGNSYTNVNDFEKTLLCYFTSLKIIEDTLPNITWEKNLRYESLILNNIGAVYSSLGDLDNSVKYIELSLKIRQQQNNIPGMATCYQNLGLLNEKKKDYGQALELYTKAIEIRQSLGNEGHVAELLMNIGILMGITGKPIPGAEKLKEAIDIFSRLGDKYFLSYSYHSLANLYLEMDFPGKAYPYIIKGIDLAKEIENKSDEAKSYSLLSQYYTQKNKYEK